MSQLKYMMAWIFSGFFVAVTLVLVALMTDEFVNGILGGKDATTTLLRTISTAVIALATFELGLGIHREYPGDDREENVYSNVRRTTTRFLGISCIALVLEALIMVIKYSQLELAGNLLYPVSIILGAAILLIALGLFLFLTADRDWERRRTSAFPLWRNRSVEPELARAGAWTGSLAAGDPRVSRNHPATGAFNP